MRSQCTGSTEDPSIQAFLHHHLVTFNVHQQIDYDIVIDSWSVAQQGNTVFLPWYDITGSNQSFIYRVAECLVVTGQALTG